MIASLLLTAALTHAPVELAQAGPGPRHHHRMVYDGERDRLVLFGGNIEVGDELDSADDTWERDGSAWHVRTGPGPMGVASHALVFDAARGRVLLFGGYRKDRTLGSTTWILDEDGWRDAGVQGPSGRHSPCLAYDPKRERVVLFGGSFRGTDAMWEWDGAVWHPITLAEDVPLPRPVMRAGFAWDAAHERLILFGGFDGTTSGETWAWDGEQWAQLLVEGPSARANFAMEADTARKRIVLFGGSDEQRVLLNDTWEWDGEAWKLVAEDGPSARTVPAMAYDSDARRIVLQGGRGEGRRALGDLWTWDGSDWNRIGEDGN